MHYLPLSSLTIVAFIDDGKSRLSTLFVHLEQQKHDEMFHSYARTAKYSSINDFWFNTTIICGNGATKHYGERKRDILVKTWV